MNDIKITVLHPTDGRELTITVEDDMTGQEFIDALLDNDFMVVKEEGYQLAIQGGCEIGADETLASNNVKDNDILRIIEATNAGGVVPELIREPFESINRESLIFENFIEKELINYVWENLNLLESIFTKKTYYTLLKYRNRSDIDSFTDTLETIIEIDSKLLDKIENKFNSIPNITLREILNGLKDTYYDTRHKKIYIDKALSLLEKEPRKDEKYILLLLYIATHYRIIKEYENALDFAKKSFILSREVLGIKNSNTAKAYQELAKIYHITKKDRDAESSYLKALKIREELREKDLIIESYCDLAIFYKDTNKYKKAESFYNKALKNSSNIGIIKSFDDFMEELNKLFFLNSNNSNLDFKIEKIEITNFKQYESMFSMEFDKKINIVIGQNAIGKTTLLQAITLALLKKSSNDIKKVDFDKYITKGKRQAEIVIFHNNNKKKIVKISKNIEESEDNYFTPFILTYGSNFFTSKTNEVKEVARNIVNATVHQGLTDSVFVDYTSGFVNPIRLLEFLDLEKSDNVDEIQDILIETINLFLEELKLVVKDGNYFFQKNNLKEKLELEDLSEGYRSNILLITDMLIKILGVGWKPRTIEGIIMIDEFDKHLHPRWQSKLVNRLTETFPKIQFIMTTHNPMSILDRNPNEITILKYTKDGIKAIRGGGTKTTDVSTVLLEYFNVESTISDSMRKKVDSFNRLKLKKELTDIEEKELEELENFLGQTVASNFIYDRKYLRFLEYIKEHKDIDFDKYEQIDEDMMSELLKDFGDFFND